MSPDISDIGFWIRHKVAGTLIGDLPFTEEELAAVMGPSTFEDGGSTATGKDPAVAGSVAYPDGYVPIEVRLKARELSWNPPPATVEEAVACYMRVAEIGARSPERIAEALRANEKELRRLVGRLPFQLPPCVDEDDVFQEATMAVMRAVSLWDASRGPLAGWLRQSVRHDVLDWLRTFRPLSGRREGQVTEVTRTMRRLEDAHRRVPTDEEIAHALGWSLEVLRNVLNAIPMREILSLEDVVAEGGDILDSGPDPFDQVWPRSCKPALTAGYRMLSRTQRRILSLHYEGDVPLREIARVLGMSKTQVLRVHQQALLRLRAALETPPSLLRNRQGQSQSPNQSPRRSWLWRSVLANCLWSGVEARLAGLPGRSIARGLLTALVGRARPERTTAQSRASSVWCTATGPFVRFVRRVLQSLVVPCA